MFDDIKIMIQNDGMFSFIANHDSDNQVAYFVTFNPDHLMDNDGAIICIMGA